MEDRDKLEKQIREILSPHFGYLKLFVKWTEKPNVTIDIIREFYEYTKDHKDIVKRLPKSLTSYTSYYSAILEIKKLEKSIKLKRIFKDGLNSKSRGFFGKTYETRKRDYNTLLRNDFKLRMFFRSSSKPQDLDEYNNYLSKILKFDDAMSKLAERIETNFDYLTLAGGAYLFQLDEDKLDFLPSVWCICNNQQQFVYEKKGRELNSIWAIVDPYTKNEDRRIVGIDVENNLKNILYMDSLNRRFSIKDNAPIKAKDFFRLTRSRLKRTSFSKIDVKTLDKETLEALQKMLEGRRTYYEEQHKGIETDEAEYQEERESLLARRDVNDLFGDGRVTIGQ